MVKITFGAACKIRFRQVLKRGQRVPCWLRVAGSPFLYCLWTYIYIYIYIYIYCATKPARSTGTCFVSKRFNACIIFNIVV